MSVSIEITGAKEDDRVFFGKVLQRALKEVGADFDGKMTNWLTRLTVNTPPRDCSFSLVGNCLVPNDEFPTITVTGPTGSGKTIVMDKIAVMLAGLGASFEPGALKCGGETLRLLSHPRDMLKPRVEKIEVAVGVNAMGAVSGVAAMAGYILGSDSVPAEIYELARSVVAGACE